ncbi:triose-phosphate isomerase [Candidatus Sumerlaeota bacterium]|nr:triose-phosphate isomerase [Candidatus Sumerlaeota bacterium]
MAERIPFIAGNWKMNKSLSQAIDTVTKLKELIEDVQDVEVAVCPPFIALDAVVKVLIRSNIAVGAQNCFWEEKGAYTGEISPLMLADIGCRYCIVGHSERRKYFGETDANVNRKVRALYQFGLLPIICVGETLEQRQQGLTMNVVEEQIRGCLSGLPVNKVVDSVIAYEPVWAIGTGHTATPEQAQEVHSFIRNLLAELYGEENAQKIRIQYGGSVTPENIKGLMAMPDIDGALVGGASLEPEKFARIVKFKQ